MLHETHAAKHIANREPSLDLIRGIAVLLMFAAHAIYFFHNDTSPLLQFIARSANTVVFTVFLFVSGAAAFFALTAEDRPTRSHFLHVLFHSFVLLVGYYAVAFVVFLTRGGQDIAPDIAGKLIPIFLFIHVPSFSEFLIPFILFSLTLIPLSSFYLLLAKRPYVGATIALALYILGVALYPLILPAPWREAKALFAGDEGLLRFPIFHYFGVFAAGLAWGRFLTQHPETSLRLKRSLLLFLGSFTIFVLATGTHAATNLAFLNPLNRWPPSVGFLSAGTTSIFFLSIFALSLPRVTTISRMYRIIRYLGGDSFDLYITHILLLHVYQRFVDWRFAHPLPVFVMYVVLLSASSLLSSLNWRISPSLLSLGPLTFSGLARHRIRKRYFGLIVILIAVTFLQLNTGRQTTTIGGVVPREGVMGMPEEGRRTCTEDQKSPWFDADYGYCRVVTIYNDHPTKALAKGDVVGLEVDLSGLFASGRAAPEGTDLLMVSAITSLPRPISQSLVPSGGANAIIFFALEEEIAPSTSDSRYTLYYGSDMPTVKPALVDRPITNLPSRVTTGSEEVYKLLLTRNRRWFLTASADTPPSPLVVTLTVREGTQGQAYQYEIRETGETGRMVQESEMVVTQAIDISDYPPGTYSVVVFEAGNPDKRGRVLTFAVSAPLLVAATLDWEGWEVPQAALDTIRDLSNRHGELPITHFFSPRVFVPERVAPEAAQKLVDFLLKRSQTHGDEVALHMHMHFDLVAAAGLTPKTEPAWGYRSEEGYDVATTAYDSQELRQLLSWAKNQFKVNGLPDPVGYRAGGWFADVSVLRALRDSGFLYDSSGRKNPTRGPFAGIPWNLTATAQPYYPSVSNQNQTGLDALTILEIPNNGGNTNEYGADVLLENLSQNFNGQPLQEPIALVYISHPQWHTLEFPRLEETLTGIDKVLYENDRGPAVYTTVRSIYDIWTQ